MQQGVSQILCHEIYFCWCVLKGGIFLNGGREGVKELVNLEPGDHVWDRDVGKESIRCHL